MTTQLIERSPAPASTIGFGNLMHSEWTKLRSVRSTYWTVIAAALSTVALAVVICIRFRQLIGQDGPGKLDGFDPTLTSLNGIYLAQIAIGTLGVLVITSEYATGMIRATFSAVPQRRAVLAAKAFVFAGATFVLGEVISFAAFGIGQAILSGAHPDFTKGSIGADGSSVDLARDFPGLHTSASLADPGVFRAVFGAGLYLAAVGLLGFGLGAMIRGRDDPAHRGRTLGILRAVVRGQRDHRPAADQLAQRHHAVPSGQRRQPDLHDRAQPRRAVTVVRAGRVLPVRRRCADRRLRTRRCARRLIRPLL